MKTRDIKRFKMIVNKIGQDIDNLADLTIEERPFLTGGELKINENEKKRKQLNITFHQRTIDLMSLCNEIRNPNS